MDNPEFRAPETEPDSPPPLDRRGSERERRARERRLADRRGSRAVTPLVGTPIAEDDWIGFPFKPRRLESVVRSALFEDGALDDVTTVACVFSDRRAHGTVIARQGGVIAGTPLAICAFRLLDPNVAIRVDADDGARVEEGSVVMRVTGLARAMLSAERVALEFLQRLSGIATLAARYADAVRGTGAQILDTGRTTPGMRELERYAVRAGGGVNRRVDVRESVYVRRNHVAALGGDVALAVRRAREFAPLGARIEVECRSGDEVRRALEAGAQAIVLDRVMPGEARACMELARGKSTIEVAGPLTPVEARPWADAGVDRIGVPALTQCAAALDLALEFEAV